MSANLEYRARERQRKKESRWQTSEAQREKGRQRSRARDKKGEIFLMEEQHENSLRSRCKCVLTVKDREWQAELSVLPRRNLELLERIYGRFPSLNHSGRFAGVPNLDNLGKPYIERENRLQYNP